MNARSTLVADGQSPKAVQPSDGALDDPAGAAQAAAVRPPALGELRGDAALRELVAMRLRIVPRSPCTSRGFRTWSAGTPAQRRHRVHQRQQLRDVVPVGGRQRRDERNPVRVGENMMFRPGLAAIGRVRSSFFPPRTARRRRTVDDRARQIQLAALPQLVEQDPCGAASRRRLVATARAGANGSCRTRSPSPGGSMFQGMPLRSTNRIPVSTARSGIGLRPAYRRLRRRRFGSSGSIRLHKSSSIKAWGMPDRLAVGQAKVPSHRSKYRGSLVNFATCS